MRHDLMKHIERLIGRYPVLEDIKGEIADAYEVLEKTYIGNGKLLIAGNGGSAADAEHMAGELMKSFKMSRPVFGALANRLQEIDPVRGGKLAENLEMPLTAIPLATHGAIITAYLNDVDRYGIFAQQILGYGREGDLFLAISTSGDSENIINAAVVARAMGIKVVGLTGQSGGKLAEMSDIAVKVPESETYMVQELHLPIYHCWCLMLEDRFFGREKTE